ncbi:MAG: CDP-glucose 4,6-dehydratase [Rhodobacteraceae bacterium]|nr:CDP-glucose 4,6-dehydratase [Paracoccaceae bacterium]
MINAEFWRGKKVLVTGHTGFKGGWLSLWLNQLGAEVHGVALAPDTTPALFDLIRLETCMASSVLLDIRNAQALDAHIARIQPEIIMHLAAQPLVRCSYDAPVETFATNVMGTAHLLEACRGLTGLQAVLVVTTDKVYRNLEWDWPYRENDALGGADPYSASKSACEMVVESYRKSFLSPAGISVATARGGNVIGGGDWSADRLIPDAVRAAFAGQVLDIRAPDSVRPWQHVLVLCHAYLQLAAQMAEQPDPGAYAWNFGPLAPDCVSVRQVLAGLAQHGIAPEIRVTPAQGKPESRMLALDSSLARARLGWHPALDLPEALKLTAEWYLAALQSADMQALTLAQITAYQQRLS